MDFTVIFLLAVIAVLVFVLMSRRRGTPGSANSDQPTQPAISYQEIFLRDFKSAIVLRDDATLLPDLNLENFTNLDRSATKLGFISLGAMFHESPWMENLNKHEDEALKIFYDYVGFSRLMNLKIFHQLFEIQKTIFFDNNSKYFVEDTDEIDSLSQNQKLILMFYYFYISIYLMKFFQKCGIKNQKFIELIIALIQISIIRDSQYNAVFLRASQINELAIDMIVKTVSDDLNEIRFFDGNRVIIPSNFFNTIEKVMNTDDDVKKHLLGEL